MPYTQEGLIATVSLGNELLDKDIFLLRGLEGTEFASGLFRFELKLVSHLDHVPFDQVIGRPLSVSVLQSDGGQRQICGIVAEFSQDGVHKDTHDDRTLIAYTAILVPQLWTLTRVADCRIFQDKSIPEIIEAVFASRGFADFDTSGLHASYEPQEYVVQYRETDFDFVSRLMEQEGIGYRFSHDEGRDLLHLFDTSFSNPPCPGQFTAVYGSAEAIERTGVVVETLSVKQEMPMGRYSVMDYNFEAPSMTLASGSASTMSLGGNERFEFYDYSTKHGSLADGDRYARIRMESEEANANQISGKSSYAGFTAGTHFLLTGHYSTLIDNQRFLLTRVVHHFEQAVATGGEPATYANEFCCIPLDVPFRPRQVTPQPRIRGIHTAVVVGPPGEEIHVDQYGRVKIQFHWDRQSAADGSDVCWARVMQSAAGKGFGTVFNPRIGQEVAVSFLEGDPDRPIVTGSVYNAERPLPFGGPETKTMTGIRSRTIGGGPQNFNELRMEDKAGEELLSMQAERDMKTWVKNDQEEKVDNDRRRRVGNDEKLQIQHDQELDLGNDQILKIGHNSSLTVGNQIRLVVGDSSITMKQDGTIIIDGVDVYVNGKELRLRGSEKIQYDSDDITGIARTKHRIRGATLQHNP